MWRRQGHHIKELDTRFAGESGSELLLDFIKRLAAYEKKSGLCLILGDYRVVIQQVLID